MLLATTSSVMILNSQRAFGQDTPVAAPAVQPSSAVTISQGDVFMADKYHPMSQLSAHLTGAQALPPNQTTSAGNLVVALDPNAGQATFRLQLNTLSSPITAIRIYKGVPGAQGQLLKTFSVQGNGVMTGANPIGNSAYMATNVDNSASVASNPGAVASPSVGNPLNTESTGTFTLGYMTVGTQYSNYLQQISQGQGANGMPSGTSSRVLDIVNQPVLMTTASAVWAHGDQFQPLDRHMLDKLTSGQLFIEVDTQNYPNGEIRGQITGASNLISGPAIEERNVILLQDRTR
jgi:hypothetical protein